MEWVRGLLGSCDMRKSALQLYFDGHLPLTCRKSVSCVTLQEMKFIEKDQYPSLRLMEERTRYVSCFSPSLWAQNFGIEQWKGKSPFLTHIFSCLGAAVFYGWNALSVMNKAKGYHQLLQPPKMWVCRKYKSTVNLCNLKRVKSVLELSSPLSQSVLWYP